MTPERWRQIGELFEAAVRIDPAGREAWLRAACGGDDELRTEVGRLLAQDERADRNGFLTPPQAAGPPSDRTASWPPRVEAPSQRPEPAGGSGDAPADETGGLTPRRAIASQTEQQTISEPSDAVRARLRELPIVYILILAASTLWSRGVLGREDATIARVDGTIILALVGLIALLWSRWPDPADLAPGPGAGGGRPARRPRHLRRIPADAEVLAAWRHDDGADDSEECRAADRRPDPHLRALRPQDLAPRRAGGRAAGAVAVRDPLGTGAAAPGGDGVALGGLAR